MRAVSAGCAALGVLTVLAVSCACGFAWLLPSLYPCWAYSNAEWCGHFCDDDPCACPDRVLGPAAYGSGPGCVP